MDSNLYLVYNELSKRIYEIKKDTIIAISTNPTEALINTFIEENFNAYEDMCYIACSLGGSFCNIVFNLQLDSIKNLVKQYPDKAKKYKYINDVIGMNK